MKSLYTCAAVGAAILWAGPILGAENPAAGVAPKAAESPKPPPVRKTERRVVSVKNKELLDAFKHILRSYPVNAEVVEPLGVIVLSGNVADVAAAEEVIQKFDVPPRVGEQSKSLTFIAHLLIARHGTATTNPLPSDLSPVVEQLRKVFPYQSYEMLDTLVLRARDGRRGNIFVNGFTRSPNGSSLPAKTRLELDNPTIIGGEEATIRIPRLTVQVDLPMTSANSTAEKPAAEYRPTIISTGIDIRPGQKVVVGKTSLDETNDGLIVVIKVDVES